jgi:nitric oxide dioxygenase
MSPEHVALVKGSFSKVVPIAPQAAELFYGRLFEIAPEVKPLFQGDMREQGRKLMAAIGMVVNSLERLDGLVPTVQAMGKRHAAYGVQDAHYGQVAEALLWTLEKGLGDAFTPATRQAWTEAYTVLADTMKAAARA